MFQDDFDMPQEKLDELGVWLLRCIDALNSKAGRERTVERGTVLDTIVFRRFFGTTEIEILVDVSKMKTAGARGSIYDIVIKAAGDNFNLEELYMVKG